MRRRNLIENEQGFTLIEIIAVLVILGILAAVAVPKFVDLQSDARDKAAEAAVAEGVAQVNQYIAKYILNNAAVPTTLAHLTGEGLDDPYEEGDFTIDYGQNPGGDDSNTNITISVTGKADTSVAGASATGEVPLPQADS